MKIKYLLPLFAILFSFNLQAQLNIGSNQRPTSRSGSGEMRPQDIKKLKRQTLVIFYGESDKENLENFNKAIQSWDFCKIQMDDIANLASYDKKRGFVFANFEADPVFTTHPNLGTKEQTDVKVYLHFWYKKGKDKLTFARLDLFPTHDHQAKLIKMKKPQEMVKYMYDQGVAYNWSPGFLKLYLRHMNAKLSAGSLEEAKENYINEEGLPVLTSNVLFYPEYLLAVKDNVTKSVEDQAEETLFEKYPYEHEMMLVEDLDNLLLEDEQGGDYVLLYVQCGNDKYYSVYNTNGELIFHRYEVNSYNMDKGDLKKIAKELD